MSIVAADVTFGPTQQFSNKALFACLLLFGLYFPTSSNGDISKPLFSVAFFTSAVLLLILAFRVGLNEKIALWISAPIVLWLISCTFFSIFHLYLINLSALAVFG